MNKTINQKAWFFVVPVFVLVAFNAAIPLMTVVNYSFQETFGNNVFAWEGTRNRAPAQVLSSFPIHGTPLTPLIPGWRPSPAAIRAA